MARCPECVVNHVGRDRPKRQSMPGIAIAAHLTEPFPVSHSGNKYLLSIIDHCTGWVEVKALIDKSAEGIHNYIFNIYSEILNSEYLLDR